LDRSEVVEGEEKGGGTESRILCARLRKGLPLPAVTIFEKFDDTEVLEVARYVSKDMKLALFTELMEMMGKTS